MTFAHRLATAFLVVAITAVALFTVLVAGGSGMLEIGLFRVTYDVAAVVAIVVWLFYATIRPAWLPSSRLTPAIIACLAAFTIATVTSRAPRLSIEMLAYAFLLAELYLLLVALMRRPSLRLHFERLAIVLVTLVGVLYLLQVFQAWLAWWGVVGRLTIPPLRPGYLGLSLGSPNPIATLVLLLGAFGLAIGRLEGRRGHVAAVVVVGLVAVVTLLSGSRGAWVGAGLGLAACTVAVLATNRLARTRAIALARTRAGAIAVVAGTAALAGAAVIAGISGRLTLDDSGYREAFASASLRMFQSSPLVGIGPGVWQVLRASYENAGQPDLYIPHAHNIYLQTLAEFGLVGIIGGLVVVASLGLLVLGAIRSEDPVRRRVGVATLFAIALLAGQQLADMLMNVPALLLAVAIPVAWLDATAPDPAPELQPAEPGRWRGARATLPRVLPLAMIALTVVTAAGLLRIEGVAAEAEQAVMAADAGQWADSKSVALRAARGDPGVTSYWFQAGIAAANAGDLATAVDALERSASADDYTYAWLNLAAVRWKLGDSTGARSALERADRLGLQQVQVALAAGWLRWQLGDRAAATADYGTAITISPTLAGDPFWSSSPDLVAARPAIMAAVRQQIEAGPGDAAALAPSLFTLRLLSGDVAAAVAELAPMPAGDRALFDLVAAAWQGSGEAEVALQLMAARHPLDPTPAEWCRLVAAHHGDRDLVARYGTLQWLGGGFLPAPPVARAVLGDTVLLQRGALDRYGSLYRRPVPDAQVIRLLPQILFQDHF